MPHLSRVRLQLHRVDVFGDRPYHRVDLTRSTALADAHAEFSHMDMTCTPFDTPDEVKEAVLSSRTGVVRAVFSSPSPLACRTIDHRFKLDLTPVHSMYSTRRAFQAPIEFPDLRTSADGRVEPPNWTICEIRCDPLGRQGPWAYLSNDDIISDLLAPSLEKNRGYTVPEQLSLCHVALRPSVPSACARVTDLLKERGIRCKHLSFSTGGGFEFLKDQVACASLSQFMGGRFWENGNVEDMSFNYGTFDPENIVPNGNIHERLTRVRLISPGVFRRKDVEPLARGLGRWTGSRTIEFEISRTGGEPDTEDQVLNKELAKAIARHRVSPSSSAGSSRSRVSKGSLPYRKMTQCSP